MTSLIIHYGLHFVYPLWIAIGYFKKEWQRAYLFIVGTMLVDLDHLLATPIFDPNRCSINFHPLHSYYFFPIYIGLLFFKKPFRWLGLGCCLHMLTDWIDCMLKSF
jgi:Family of unknown function (DUF6122)